MLPVKQLFSAHWLLSICFVLILGAQSSSALDEDCSQPLWLGWESAAPFLYLDARQQLQGLDYELVAAALQDAGCSVVYLRYETPWKRQLLWVEEGYLDLLVGASKTPEREQYAWFSQPYRNESVTLFVRQGDTQKYRLNSLQDILHRPFGKLGIYRGSYYGEDFVRLMAIPAFRNKTFEVGANKQGLDMLLKGRLDGILLDSISGIEFLRQEGVLGKQVERYPMPAITTGDIHVMFSKRTTPAHLVERFNQGLAHLHANGTYADIMKKYAE